MEPLGHCPFVGLKQSRAIRFSSQTPEHRCYIDGTPMEIPVDQESFCLSHNHIHCPLYTGLRTATTEVPPVAPVLPGNPKGIHIPQWFTTLSSRDRLAYGVMLGLLAGIVLIYLVSGLQSLTGMPDMSQRTATVDSTSQIVVSNPTARATEAATLTASAVLPAPTALPTHVPTQRPTDVPTRAPVFFPPTLTPVPPTTALPATAVLATSTPQIAATNTAQATSGAQSSATGLPQATQRVPSSTQPPASNTPQPPATRQPAQPTVSQPTAPKATTQPPATRQPAQPTAPKATVQPQPVEPTAPARVPTAKPIPPTAKPTVQPIPPTAKPTVQPIPPTAVPTAVPAPPTAVPTAVPAPPTAVPPAAERRNEVLWLYFGDTTGTLYVPVQRTVMVENKQVARAALQALIAGPRHGLTQVLDPAAQLLDVRIENGTAIANFDRNPILDGRGRDAIALTLTHFNTIQRVQLQVQGQNLDAPRARPVLNPINPLGLPVDYDQTAFLPLYFMSVDGSHQVRVIRMVPKTTHTAEGTVRALLEGPGSYDYALRRVIPAGTELRGISLDAGIVTVDLSQPFVDADDRKAAVQTLSASLTTLPGVKGVRILVEGKLLSDYWGDGYGAVFYRPAINAE